MSNSELVSASTDSTLRSWNTLDFEPVRTYSGHVNEKNFVGLSLSGNFIACGSETSEVRWVEICKATSHVQAVLQMALLFGKNCISVFLTP